MTHPNQRKLEVAREARRQNVVNILLAGISGQAQIASILEQRYDMKVERSTISRDIKAIEDEWRRERVDVINTEKGKDLARLERLIAAHWQKSLAGDQGSTTIVLKALGQRATLLGLNAPIRVNWRLMLNQTADNLGLSADERNDLAARVQRRVAEIGPHGRVA